MRPGRGRDECGAATVLVLAMAGLLCVVVVALAAVGGLVRAQRTAQSAADLAALSAASSIAHGNDGCAQAAVVAAANGAGLVSCSVREREARVVVEVPGPRWLGRPSMLTGEARAGPG